MIARTTVVAVMFGVVIAGSACAEEVNPVLGRVGDFVLREADLERFIGYQAAEGQKQLKADPEKRIMLVKQLLIGRAVAEKAKKEGFDKKPEVKEQLSFVIDDFLSREFLYRKVSAQTTVSEEELKKFYKENEKDLAVGAEVKVRHIFFNARKDASDEDKAKARAKAEGALARLKKGEDYAKLAQELSEDASSAGKGGELGYIAAGGGLDEFEKAAFALKAGEISNVVETPYGYHIIKIDERREQRTASYDEAKEYIRGRLQPELERQKLQEYVDLLTKEAGLEMFPEKITGKKQE